MAWHVRSCCSGLLYLLLRRLIPSRMADGVVYGSPLLMIAVASGVAAVAGTLGSCDERHYPNNAKNSAALNVFSCLPFEFAEQPTSRPRLGEAMLLGPHSHQLRDGRRRARAPPAAKHRYPAVAERHCSSARRWAIEARAATRDWPDSYLVSLTPKDNTTQAWLSGGANGACIRHGCAEEGRRWCHASGPAQVRLVADSGHEGVAHKTDTHVRGRLVRNINSIHLRGPILPGSSPGFFVVTDIDGDARHVQCRAFAQD